MTMYFVMALLLSLTTAGSLIASRAALYLGCTAGLMLASFAGLRFETGFDWPVYQVAFSGPDARLPTVVVSSMEPLFLGYNHLVRMLGGTFQFSLFITAAFNIAVLTWAIARLAPQSISAVLMVYFAIVFLPAQMSMVRQSIASSFIIIALILMADRRFLWALLFGIAAVGFQYSAALLLPLLFLRWRPPGWIAIAFVSLGIALTLLSIDALPALVVLADVAGLSDKLRHYVEIGRSPLSLAAISLTIAHMTCLLIFYIFASREESSDPYIVVGIWLTIWMLGAHLYCSGTPVLWNRFMLVCLPWQIACVFRLRVFHEMQSSRKVGAVTTLCLVSVAALFYFLRNPKHEVFVPYNSIVQVSITGETGDGAERWLRSTAEFERDVRKGIQPFSQNASPFFPLVRSEKRDQSQIESQVAAPK